MATYRFMKTSTGATFFARIAVKVIPRRNDIVLIPSQLQTNQSTGNPMKPDWITAAREGVESALRIVAARSPGFSDAVSITCIEGTDADTTADAIKCAAFMATFEELLPHVTLPRISDDRPWRPVIDEP